MARFQKIGSTGPAVWNQIKYNAWCNSITWLNVSSIYHTVQWISCNSFVYSLVGPFTNNECNLSSSLPSCRCINFGGRCFLGATSARSVNVTKWWKNQGNPSRNLCNPIQMGSVLFCVIFVCIKKRIFLVGEAFTF